MTDEEYHESLKNIDIITLRIRSLQREGFDLFTAIYVASKEMINVKRNAIDNDKK